MNNKTYLVIWALLLSVYALPLQAQIYTVNSFLDQDDGVCNGAHCSLREAVAAANADNMPSAIHFAFTGSAPFVIQLATPLPAISDAGTIIDGSSQAGFSPGDIIIDGGLLTGGNESGLLIDANNTSVFGLHIRNFSLNGIEIKSGQNIQIGSLQAEKTNIIGGNQQSGVAIKMGVREVKIEGNYLGTGSDGVSENGNGVGISLIGTGAGIEAAEIRGNLISGNLEDGVFGQQLNDLLIDDNRIGTDASGLNALPNRGNGVQLIDCNNVQIGLPGAGNLISGNRANGLLISRADLSINIDQVAVQANKIGTDVAGIFPLGNRQSGVDCSQIESGLIIGGVGAGEGNLIADNNNGLSLNNCKNSNIQGNFIGVDASGQINMGNNIAGIALLSSSDILVGGSLEGATNTVAFNQNGVWVGPGSRYCQIKQNSFFCNQAAGISISPGSNEGVNAPAFICAFPDEISGLAPPNSTVEVFRNGEGACPNLVCQGKEFIGETIANATGRWSLSGNYDLDVGYTATATNSNNNTSIFLECVPARIRPRAFADNTGPYCENANIRLLGNANLSGVTFQWTGPDGFSSSRQNPDNALAEGQYILQVQQGGCSSAPDTTTVRFTDAVYVDIGANSRGRLCPGESIVINGTRYDENNSRGQETVSGGNNACDTIYNIDLQFSAIAEFRLDSTICPGENVRVQDEVFNFNRPFGAAIIENAGQFGCDSIVIVSLSFYEGGITQIDTTLCRGSSFIFNGEIYNEEKQTGMALIPGGSDAGCDSLININVRFFPPASYEVDTILCLGEQLVLNDIIYDVNNPFGVEILPGAGARGCDSIINVQLRFDEAAESRIDTTLCRGGGFTFNGTRYDEAHPSGREFFSGAANGCDSIVIVNIQFEDPPEINLDTSLCQGQFLLVNGTRYDAAKPQGVETISGQAGRCDTVLLVNINFTSEVRSELRSSLCPGDSLIVNGRVYNEINPSGVERISNGSIMGCDSLIEVLLTYLSAAELRLEETLCPGESLSINNVVYNENKPNGIEILPGAGAAGCDSTIIVSLSFENLQLSFSTQDPVCGDDEKGFLQIDAINGGAPPFNYSLNNGETKPLSDLPFQIGDLADGFYELNLSDANGCNATASATIQSSAADFSLDLGPDLSLKTGDSIRLQAQTDLIPGKIEWSPEIGLSCTDCLHPMASPVQTTVYTLTISDLAGCSVSDKIRIEVIEASVFFVPNAFSPNEDGENDLLLVYGNPAEVNLVRYFQIFDRWGALIFERQDFPAGDENAAWDGRINGRQIAPPGVYIYSMGLELKNGAELNDRGTINLIR